MAYLEPGSFPPSSLEHDALRLGLRELGYVEGQNLAIEYRFAEGQPDRLAPLAAELVRVDPDVIVTTGTLAVRAAKNATSTTPIVMAAVADAVGAGFVASLARPGGNITGLTNFTTQLIGKQLQLVKEAFPGTSRVAIPTTPGNPIAALGDREADVAASALGIQLVFLEFQSIDDLEAAVEAAARERVDALLVRPNPINRAYAARLVDPVAQNRLPAMYAFREAVDAGGLMAYGPSIPDMYRRAAAYVDRIFKGAKPADLPVEQPTTFEFVINLKTAQALGLTIPQHVLLQATEVLQ